MSTVKQDVFQMIYALPEKSLLSLKPLLNELLVKAVLIKDPYANVSEMDTWDMALFLKADIHGNDDNYVSFEDALVECGVSMDEVYDSH